MNGRPLSRRTALGALGGGLTAIWLGFGVQRTVGRWTTSGPGSDPATTLPSSVATSARSKQAYEAAYANLGLLATLPCYCGCATLPTPHASLRECFQTPGGKLELHASGCGICQDEALDAVAWAEDDVAWPEIHRRIVTTYSDRRPGSPGTACSPTSCS